MDALLARLERRFGRFAIANLTTVIVGGMAVVFVLSRLRGPEFTSLLTLDLERVRHGQVWRLFTYLFIPTTTDYIWILFSLYWVWMVGSNLENEWGPFKFNAYYAIGMIGTTIAAVVTGYAVGNVWLNGSLLLAFATAFPEYEIFLFFILRIKMKWLGFLMAGYALFQLAVGDWATRGAIIAAFANYFLFFGVTLIAIARGRRLIAHQAARRASSGPPPPVAAVDRACAICGKLESDGADIRVCSCEKCGTPRLLCLAHARNH
jgi:membrane associated rhomboid family serine protease